MIIRRYSDESGNMDFDNYIGCLVRLDAMCRKFYVVKWSRRFAMTTQTDCSFPSFKVPSKLWIRTTTGLSKSMFRRWSVIWHVSNEMLEFGLWLKEWHVDTVLLCFQWLQLTMYSWVWTTSLLLILNHHFIYRQNILAADPCAHRFTLYQRNRFEDCAVTLYWPGRCTDGAVYWPAHASSQNGVTFNE